MKLRSISLTLDNKWKCSLVSYKYIKQQTWQLFFSLMCRCYNNKGTAMKFCRYKGLMTKNMNEWKYMQLLRIKYLITEKNFSQNNCESNVLNIYRICSLGFKELILKRASSESKIVEKTLRAGCAIIIILKSKLISILVLYATRDIK